MKLSRVCIGIKGLGLSLVLGAGLVGCAVLTVDVDVYKGALVNEEQVQLHQLLALATAAKPMLVQLRDSIEWPSEEMPVKTDQDKKKWYKSGYVKPPEPTVPPKTQWWCKKFNILCDGAYEGYDFFRNRLAVRVNEVLRLYEDLDDQEQKRTRESIDPAEGIGLTTLAENYRMKSREVDRSTFNIDQKEQEKALANYEKWLINALVNFSQKVLFLANHEGLASPPGTPGLILGGAEKLNRGLLGDFLTDHGMYRLFNSELAEAKKQQYVRVLQAVGNSILFSANELRERERYREHNQRKVEAEVTAANSVYSPPPTKVFDDLLRELELQKITAQTELTTARTQKAQIEVQIGSAVAPKSGLHLKKENASSELTKAEQDLNDYRSKHSTLEAIHQILTDTVSKQVKAQWSTGQQESTDEDDFLIGAGGLKEKLAVVRHAQDGVPSADETSKWNAAVLYVESSDARQAFKAYRATERLTTLKRADLLDHFMAYLRWSDANRTKHIREYETARKEKSELLRNRIEDIATLSAEVTRLGERISKIPGEIADLTTSKTEIESIKADVLKEADLRRQFVSPGAMYLLISSHLEKKTSPASKTAQGVLSTRTPPPGMPPLKSESYKGPMEVMDAVIALLRHRQMEAVQRHGKDSFESKLATEAVENAYRHRAGMVYIRPSSAYLRTSFPSTSLQDDPNLAWDNMLLKQGLRNLPFSSELRDILDPSVKQDRSLTSELDKQYWQNINRVRVSGAGFTNQALVKDDVGNWYVKQYYGNTEQIWQSAKNLALFSLSSKMPVDLAKQLSKTSGPDAASEASKESPTLQKVLEKHQGAYKTHTDEIRAKLDRLHTKDGKGELQARILAEWDGIAEVKNENGSKFRAALLGALEAEIQEWDNAASALKSKAGQDQGQVILKDVQALSRLDRMLSARIKELAVPESIKPPKDSTEPSVNTRVVSVMHRMLGTLIVDLLNDRNHALDRYEQAIVFIGDAANPKDAEQLSSNNGTLKYEDVRK